MTTNYEDTNDNILVETTPFEHQVWAIINDHTQRYGLVHQQIGSMNQFYKFGVQEIIDKEPDIVVHPADNEEYRVQIGEIYLPKAQLTDSVRKTHLITPHECRVMDLFYDSPLHVDIIETLTRDGEIIESSKHRRVVIARLPVMLRSVLCNLSGMSREERIARGEDESDPGGYFIVRGNERVLVGQLRANYNQITVVKCKDSAGKKNKFAWKADMRSMSTETGHSVLIKAFIDSRERQVLFSLPCIRERLIPAGIVLKAMGITDATEITQVMALQGVRGEQFARTIVRDSEMVDSQEAALDYIGRFSTNTPRDKRRDYAWQVVESELFPHMGITATMKEKALLIGTIIRKLVHTCTKWENRQPDNIDNYARKRVNDPGVLMYDLFRNLYKKLCSYLQKNLDKPGTHPKVMTILSRAQGSITKDLHKCFLTGNWGVPGNSYIVPGVSQILSRLAYASSISHRRRIAIPGAKESKNALIRAIQPTSYGFVCPVETPEGKSSGVVLNYSFLAHTSPASDPILVKEVLERLDEELLVPIEEMKLSWVRDNPLVFLNGELVGITSQPESLVEKLRSYKGTLFDRTVSSSYDVSDNEVHIFSDAGRFVRPVFTPGADGLDLRASEGTDWGRLVQSGRITYIDAAEQEWSELGMYWDEKDVDFYELHPAMMMGLLGNAIPWPDHTQSPRNIYQCLDPDEPVRMADGSTKRIGDIRKGNQVISVDPKTLATSVTTVVNQYIRPTIQPIIRLTTTSGRRLTCTVDHPVLTAEGWRRADEAKTICVSPRQQKAYFETIRDRENLPDRDICDITTASDNHSFIAGDDLVVHNSNMGKQAMGVYAKNFLIRTDTVGHTLRFPQSPIVSPKMAGLMGLDDMPSGINVIAAILTYGGDNQEDSTIMNESAIQRGLFVATSRRCICEQERKLDASQIERIMVPPADIRKVNVNYSLLDSSGVVREGLVVKRDDVIIGKVRTKMVRLRAEEKTEDGSAYKEINTDISVRVKRGHEGVIDRVIDVEAPNGYRLVKIIIRKLRVPEVGDKVASRSAQKGTIGATRRQEDLPFTAEGIVPDIIINPHAFPSRMTINQLMETVLGKACVLSGDYGDASPWSRTLERRNDPMKIVNDITDRLRSVGGYQAQGKEVMYNGLTGEPLEAMVFIGPTFYQRLKHNVDDKIHARAQGHVTNLTRQPQEGRSRDGALRFGEMERDNQILHGCTQFLKERLFKCSDPFAVRICQQCGIIASNLEVCTMCGSSHIPLVEIPYASKLVFQELQAMLLKVKLIPSQ